MAITPKELNQIISTQADIEKITKVSSDSKNLLTRIPKEISHFFHITKHHSLRWNVDIKNKEITLQVLDEKDKKKNKNRWHG